MQKLFRFLLVLFIIFFVSFNSHPQVFRVIESSSDQITIKFNFSNSYNIIDTIFNGLSYQKIKGEDNSLRNPGEPWLPEYIVLSGIPFNCNPTISILEQNQSLKKNQMIVPYPDGNPDFVKQDFEKINKSIYSKDENFPKSVVSLGESYTVRYARILPIKISPFQFNPVTRDLTYNNVLTIRINFNSTELNNIVPVNDVITNEFLENTVINFDIAKNFSGKSVSTESKQMSISNWYDPEKNYFKIYLKQKGVYRITYEELIAAGAQLGSNTDINKLEIFNEGLSIPIEIFDINNDLYFNSGDYLQFVGIPPTPSPACSLNIYNLTNIYWFSYESDSTGVYYINTPGWPDFYEKSYFVNKTILHFERDSLYEQLGLALANQERDYWFWEKASSLSGQPSKVFNQYFESFPNWFYPDSAYVRLKIALQGMNVDFTCQNDHKAYVSINEKPIGDISWNGQSNTVFDKMFYSSLDSIPIYPGNNLHIEVRGDVCPTVGYNDEIRINWFEFEYWRGNSVFGKYYNFINYDESGINRYAIFDWEGSDIRIYIPSKNKLIYYNGTGSFVHFIDTMNVKTEYFLVASDHFSVVDSLKADSPSDLQNSMNGSDYLIITHSKFKSIAEQLAAFRQNNFPDTSINNPRIKVVDVQDIYDEFSYGLLEPYAIYNFIKNAFDNWQTPSLSYVVLMGDMSHDYRGLLESSRPNYIPSIPYFSDGYGQAASDNLFVTVSGNDVKPDIAIGRLSMETEEEGNILLQKLINYPDDTGKPWKQNVLMLASGLYLADEISHGFNDQSLILGNSYVNPNGYKSSYVFRYPSKPEHEPYQGEGPKIREEINKGAAIVNYYGHGGGYQWDLVFTNEDIYLLENEGRLPVVLSVTCYTAHYDNQEVFGEQFNSVEGKGSIGFFGSSGLTYWSVGVLIDNKLFEDIFHFRNFIIGKAIMNSKNRIPSGSIYATQINLLTYLGDPVMKLALPNYPDFEIKSTDITLNPENPLIGDTISVKIKIANWGTVFPDDSVNVELFASSQDTSYQIGLIKKANFAEIDSAYFPWIPNKGELYTLVAKVNESEIIMEEDHSDNVAEARFVIFNLNEPSSIKPTDGFSTSNNSIEFLFSEIGYYLHKDLKYYIQIDTSLNFTQPLINSNEILPEKSFVKWNSPVLVPGVYFWRARIFDGTQFGNWSPVKSFSITTENKNGYYAHENILKTFNTYNIKFSETSKSLLLNTDPLPARPTSKTFIEDIFPLPAMPDSLNLTSLTTDGTYLYFGSIWFYSDSTNGMSFIYRIGTGNNGTVKGQFYGTFSTFHDTILHSITYHSDGYLYVAIGKPYSIVRINTATALIDTVEVLGGLLRWDTSKPTDGPQYLTSDGQYIYNLTVRDSLGNHISTVRKLDPLNNWVKVGNDVTLFGPSYDIALTGFFVHGDYIYTAEYFNNYLRKYRLDNGNFVEEWLAREPHPQIFQHYFSWCWDWQNDDIYASVFLYPTISPKIGKFAGYYVDANGWITTNSVGPVAWWNNLKYDFNNPSPTGEFKTYLMGENSNTKIWDTIQVSISDSTSLSNINSDLYPRLQLKFDMTDSSFTTTEPMELKSVQFDYHPLSDVYFEREDFVFEQDSLLQGYPITFNFKARSYGDLPADTLNLNFYLNGLDSLLYNPTVRVPADSFSNSVQYTLETNELLFENTVQVFGEQNKREYFYFNNLIDKNFFVARDSIRPTFSITFDGVEIINEDIVSSTPEVVITLGDNSPLALDTTYFTIVHNNIPLHFYDPDISWEYDGPGTPFVITWTPTLEDGRHTLEILAKDASGNFFDSTSYRIIFYVFSENDITEVFNYPNPFPTNTHFTFLLRGNDKPDELDIKIYTIAGRLIRVIKLGPSDLITNFNKIGWDGKDQDGDEIGNGVYLYKVIAKFPDKTKTITQKLAKVK